MGKGTIIILDIHKQKKEAVRQTNGQIVRERRTHGWMEGWIDGRTDGRTDGRADGQTDRRTHTHRHTHTHTHTQ